MQKFNEIDALPLKINIFVLDERTVVESTGTFASHVKSHKPCCLQIVITKLARALK